MEQSTASESPLAMLDQYWGIVRRRKWLILSCVVLSVVVAAVLCLVLPRSYRSGILILVENQKIPERYVQGVVTGTVQERVDIIRQQVMSRTALSRVVKKFNLDREGDGILDMEEAIGKMRRNIGVNVHGKGIVRSFSITFVHENPVVATQVVDTIASQFIEEHLKIREQFVDSATEFLDQELERAKRELETKEQQISKYKSEHMGELPEQMQANIATLNRIQNESNIIGESLQHSSERLGVMEKEINQYINSGMIVPSLRASDGRSDAPFVRLRELEQKLASLSAEYKNTYPDIILTRKEIAKLKAQIEASGGLDAEQTADEEPVDPYASELIRQRRELESEIVRKKARQHKLILQQKEYEKRVERAPELEQELLSLRRDYDNMKANYQSLLGKRLNARVAGNLEKRQKGEQFRILDPAHVPSQPFWPNQPRIMLMGLGVGLGLGFGLAFLLEQMSPLFRLPEEIEKLLGLQVVAVIPDFALGPDRAKRSRRGNSSEGALPGMDGEAKPGVNEMGRPGGSRGSRARMLWGRQSEVSFDESLVTKWQQTSVVAEQYRVAATKLALMDPGRSSSVIVFTSSVKGEGKTTTATNVAYTSARDLGRKTLLVDCDLKCPSVHKHLSLAAQPGMADVLKKSVALEECLQQVGELPLSVIPAGDVSGGVTNVPKPEELAAIVARLRGQFEYILVDAPPILPLADMTVLSGLADLVVLVVRAGHTQQDVVRKALKSVRLTTEPYVILNCAEVQTMPYYMHYGYYSEPTSRQRV